MRIQLLIADSDQDYSEHLSRVLAEKYADVFEVSTCSGSRQLAELLKHRRFEAALLSPDLVMGMDLSAVCLPLELWDGAAQDWVEGAESIRKFQRISTLASEIMERCAEIAPVGKNPSGIRAKITAAWSPAGGVGTTTVALAYAAQRISQGRKTAYLDLEPFSSVPAFFANGGKSISTVFEKLDGRAELLLQGIRQEDAESGICYFRRPDNYEDISILSGEDVTRLAEAAASGIDELVVDLGSSYDVRSAAILELADAVLLVVDGSQLCKTKWEQFRSQHNLYEKIYGKSVLVANKGARGDASQAAALVSFPVVRSGDPTAVYKTLSAGYFAG